MISSWVRRISFSFSRESPLLYHEASSTSNDLGTGPSLNLKHTRKCPHLLLPSLHYPTLFRFHQQASRSSTAMRPRFKRFSDAVTLIAFAHLLIPPALTLEKRMQMIGLNDKVLHHLLRNHSLLQVSHLLRPSPIVLVLNGQKLYQTPLGLTSPPRPE